MLGGKGKIPNILIGDRKSSSRESDTEGVQLKEKSVITAGTTNSPKKVSIVTALRRKVPRESSFSNEGNLIIPKANKNRYIAGEDISDDDSAPKAKRRKKKKSSTNISPRPDVSTKPLPSTTSTTSPNPKSPHKHSTSSSSSRPDMQKNLHTSHAAMIPSSVSTTTSSTISPHTPTKSSMNQKHIPERKQTLGGRTEEDSMRQTKDKISPQKRPRIDPEKEKNTNRIQPKVQTKATFQLGWSPSPSSSSESIPIYPDSASSNLLEKLSVGSSIGAEEPVRNQISDVFQEKNTQVPKVELVYESSPFPATPQSPLISTKEFVVPQNKISPLKDTLNSNLTLSPVLSYPISTSPSANSPSSGSPSVSPSLPPQPIVEPPIAQPLVNTSADEKTLQLDEIAKLLEEKERIEKMLQEKTRNEVFLQNRIRELTEHLRKYCPNVFF